MSRPTRTPFAVSLAALIVLAAWAAAAHAQAVRSDLDITDGTVYATLETAGRLFIGGDFAHVGPATGNSVAVSTTTGQPLWLPQVNGTVLAVAPDGSGGWYLGGAFSSVAGVPRKGLAHVRSNQTLSPWNPAGPGSSVNSLLVIGNLVYVGGHFSSMGGQVRHNLAAVDTATALSTAWAPEPDGTVVALAVSNSTSVGSRGRTSPRSTPPPATRSQDSTPTLIRVWRPCSRMGARSTSAAISPTSAAALTRASRRSTRRPAPRPAGPTDRTAA